MSATVIIEATAQDGYGSTSVYDRVATLPKNKHLFIIPPNHVWTEQLWKDSVYRIRSRQIANDQRIRPIASTDAQLQHHVRVVRH